MSNQLEQLKTMTIVVADTGDIEAIEKYQPIDATTNPSLVYKAAQLDKYQALLKQCKQDCFNGQQANDSNISSLVDYFSVQLGKKILALIPGRISTEVDARLSFDQDLMLEKARCLIGLYENEGISRDRILIKLASTWEGIKAAEILEKENINCNLTLIFSFTQALAAAQSGAFLISPFVGRILDWYKIKENRDSYPAQEDPGVVSVQQIYKHFKQHNLDTIVMGASFRNIDEIRHLAGCDRLTISPQLMQELESCKDPLEQKLSSDSCTSGFDNATLNETQFRQQLGESAMATEKLAEGIQGFTTDQEKLEQLLLAL